MRIFNINRLAYFEDLENDPDVKEFMDKSKWITAYSYSDKWTPEFIKVKGLVSPASSANFEIAIQLEMGSIDGTETGFHPHEGYQIFYLASADVALSIGKYVYDRVIKTPENLQRLEDAVAANLSKIKNAIISLKEIGYEPI